MINAADGGRITDGTLNSVLRWQSYAMDAMNSYLANLDLSPPSRRRSGNVILGGDEHYYTFWQMKSSAMASKRK
jgi:hypothetical protein